MKKTIPSNQKRIGFRVSTGIRAGNMLTRMYYSIPHGLRSFT